MNLKYYKATNKIRQSTPKDSYYKDYESILDLSFDNAPNIVYNEIEYEETYGKKDFKTIEKVRVDTVLDYNTGIILGDDYKTFIFNYDFPIQPFYGMKFKWKGNYWLVINTNSYGSMVTSAEVRRCNNTLRFFNEKGERVSEPCIVDYTLRFANNEDTKTIVVGNGEQKVWCQRNDNTTLISANDRFLFGSPKQRVAFRVYGGGTKNYLNSITDDDNSPTLIEFYLDHYEINPLFDDLENGYADAYLNEVIIKIENPISTMKVGESDVLEAKVYRAGIEIQDINIEWTSSNPEVINIENNLSTAMNIGSSTIMATIKDSNISSSLDVNVVDEPVTEYKEIVVEPEVDYILQGQNKQFSAYLYINGVRQEESIDFTDLTKNVPHDKYNIEINDNNHFTIYNEGMYMDYPISLRCSNDDTIKIINIQLRGLY